MAEEKKVSKDRGKWFREMRSELKKVVWPDGKTTAKNTGTVLLCSLIVGAAIWILMQWQCWRWIPLSVCSPEEREHG